MYERILVPVDGSPCSDEALAHAARLAKCVDGKVTLLHALDLFARVRDGMVVVAELDRALREAGERIVSRGREIAAREGIQADAVVADGSPLEEILRAAEGCDLIVMGHHGRGYMTRLLVGSVTSAVIHHATRPVLVVPAK